MNVDIQKIREDFPILSRTVYGKPLVYFDNGATTQKPRLVSPVGATAAATSSSVGTAAGPVVAAGKVLA